MSVAEVITLHDEPSLQDITGHLRSLADRIDNGEYGDVEGLFAIMPREQQYPAVFAWGCNSGAFEPIIQLELARQWLIRAGAGLPVE